MDSGVENSLGMIQAHYIYYALYFYYYHIRVRHDWSDLAAAKLYLRSSGIRSWRLGTPGTNCPKTYQGSRKQQTLVISHWTEQRLRLRTLAGWHPEVLAQPSLEVSAVGRPQPAYLFVCSGGFSLAAASFLVPGPPPECPLMGLRWPAFLGGREPREKKREPLRWKPCLGLKLKDMPSLLLCSRATVTGPGTEWEGTGDRVVSRGTREQERLEAIPEALLKHCIIFLKEYRKDGERKTQI